jgi:hypothetical protein
MYVRTRGPSYTHTRACTVSLLWRYFSRRKTALCAQNVFVLYDCVKLLRAITHARVWVCVRACVRVRTRAVCVDATCVSVQMREPCQLLDECHVTSSG